MDILLQYLHSIHPLSEQLREHLYNVLKEKQVRKREFTLRAGHVCRTIAFVSKGLFRCYYLKDDTEISSWFMMEGDIIISVESFFQQKASYESIEALEDSSIYYIDYTQLQHIYRNYAEFNFIGRVLTERYYTLSEQRLYSLRMQRSYERYEHMMKHFPQVIQRVPSKFISSYLGIAEETLSRIRSRK